MASSRSENSIAVTKTLNVLVVTMQADLDLQKFDAMRRTVLRRAADEAVRAVVLDFSAVDVINLSEFQRVHRFLASIRLLGAHVAIVSLSPAVVLYLTEMQAPTEGVEFLFGLDEALQRFGKKKR